MKKVDCRRVAATVMRVSPQCVFFYAFERVIYLCLYLYQSLPDVDDDLDERAQKAIADIVQVRTAGEKVNIAAKAPERKVPVDCI
jgi:hypothetical protein